MITCKYFKRREIKSQKNFDVSQIIESTFASICTSACTTELVSFSCEDAVGPENILSYLALIIDRLRGSGASRSPNWLVSRLVQDCGQQARSEKENVGWKLTLNITKINLLLSAYNFYMYAYSAVLETSLMQVTTWCINDHEREVWRKRGAQHTKNPGLRDNIWVLRCHKDCDS